METIIRKMVEAGLTEADAKTAYAVMLDYVKEKLPMGLGDHLESLIAGNLDWGNLMGGFGAKEDPKEASAMDKLKDMFGK